MKTIKAIALQHLTSEGKMLAIGHAETPESIYGIFNYPFYVTLAVPLWFRSRGQTEHKHKLSSMMHKNTADCIMTNDFRKDPHFPLIALTMSK